MLPAFTRISSSCFLNFSTIFLIFSLIQISGKLLSSRFRDWTDFFVVVGIIKFGFWVCSSDMAFLLASALYIVIIGTIYLHYTYYYNISIWAGRIQVDVVRYCVECGPGWCRRRCRLASLSSRNITQKGSCINSIEIEIICFIC